MHFENLNNAGDGRGMSPWPYAMCMQWPWLEAYPEQVDQAWSRLHSILFNAHRLWNEPETTRKVIVPILTELLGFSADELSETPVPVRYAGSSALLPDFTLPGACVIEAKRMKRRRQFLESARPSNHLSRPVCRTHMSRDERLGLVCGLEGRGRLLRCDPLQQLFWRALQAGRDPGGWRHPRLQALFVDV